MTNTARSTSGKAAPAKARFGQDSVEFKSLLTMFKSADIQPTEKPASVRARCPKLFEKFTPAQFRAQHSKARTLSGVQGEHHGSVFDFLLLLLSNFFQSLMSRKQIKLQCRKSMSRLCPALLLLLHLSSLPVWRLLQLTSPRMPLEKTL